MEIFSLNSRYISNLVIQYQNKEIDKKILNHNMFADLAFNYFYFKKKIVKQIESKESKTGYLMISSEKKLIKKQKITF